MVAAKRHEFLEDIEVEDARELMHPELTKGKDCHQGERGRQGTGRSHCQRWPRLQIYGLCLQTTKRWPTIIRGRAWWARSTSASNRRSGKRRGSSPQFFEEVYLQMHDWLQHKPGMHPLHSRDLLNPDNGNYSL